MNIFEGSRRIAKLFGLLIVVGYAIVIVFVSNETVYVHYLISAQGKPTVRVDECGPGSASKSKYTTSRRGSAVNASLCFEFPKVVESPVAKDTNPSLKREWETARPVGFEAFIQQNSLNDSYMSREMESFQIPESDEDHISRLSRTQALKNAGMYILWMLASLAVFWAFTWAVGWIVRGFLGIPLGRDRNEAKD